MPVAIVKRAFAQRFFPASDPVGQSLRLVMGKPPVRIVGIVEDAIQFELGEIPKPVVAAEDRDFALSRVASLDTLMAEQIAQ